MSKTQNTFVKPTLRARRVYAIDSAKGVGILLVVFGHAWRGAYASGLIPQTVLFDRVDHAIYAFHMPLFFFLSGLLFLETLKKHPAGSLVSGRIRRLLWPMALWTWVFFGVKLLAGSATNDPVTVADFPLVPLPPYEHLWFLWALFLTQCIVIGVFVPLRGIWPTEVFRGVAGVAAVVLALSSSFFYVPSLLWGPMVQHIPYFLAGIGFGAFAILRTPQWLAIVSGIAFAWLLAGVAAQGASVGQSLVLVLLLWVVWSRIDASAATAPRLLAVLRYLGTASMAIYLSHTIFSAAVRVILLKIGAGELWLVLIATWSAGVLCPLVLLSLARRFGLVRILGL